MTQQSRQHSIHPIDRQEDAVRRDLTTLLHKLSLAYLAECHPDASPATLIEYELLIALTMVPAPHRHLDSLTTILGIHRRPLTHALQHMLASGQIRRTRHTLSLTALGRREAIHHHQLTHIILSKIHRLSLATMQELYQLGLGLLAKKQAEHEISPDQLCAPCTYFQPFHENGANAIHLCRMTNRTFQARSTPQPTQAIRP
ncbi:MAG: hypothetical protein AAB433_02955 [Nitrospirota bacterium]|jgi:hypothetical protein